MITFANRREAGRLLAERLAEYANRTDVTVLAIPRGGVPVAYEVARALSAPLDVMLVSKVYAPGRDDVQIGTVTSGGFELLETEAIASRAIDPAIVGREMARARQDMAYQERLYRGMRPPPAIKDRTVIVIYDGIVTGGSMRAAVAALRAGDAADVIVAAPVASPNARAEIELIADACVCVTTPQPVYRIGLWYDDFAPTTDASVLLLLDGARTVLTVAA